MAVLQPQHSKHADGHTRPQVHGAIMANEPSGVSVYSPKIANEALVRKFISLNGSGYVAISIQAPGTVGSQATAVDPDAGSLSLAIWYLDPLTSPPPTNPYG